MNDDETTLDADAEQTLLSPRSSIYYALHGWAAGSGLAPMPRRVSTRFGP